MRFCALTQYRCTPLQYCCAKATSIGVALISDVLNAIHLHLCSECSSMHIITRDLLETCLIMLSKVPGRKALLLLPLAYGYSKIDSHFNTSVADSDASKRLVTETNLLNTAPGAAAPAVLAGPAAGDKGGLAELFSKVLGQNEFATGGLTLALIGAAAASARLAVGSALRYCRRHVMVTAEIDSRDDAYRWVMHWLSEHPKFKNSTMVSVTTNLSGTFGTSVAQHAVGARHTSTGPAVAYLPAPGDHLLRYKGRWLCISRRRTTGNPQLAANARLLLETLRISMLGTDRRPLESLLAEAAAAYNHSQATRTAVHSVDQDGYWLQVGSRPIRPLSTVVLPQNKAESLLADCQEFLESEEWYAHHGIPYRRGYLLHGPPGTGKTSLVMALAGALGLEIYVVTLSSPTMTDETLRNLLNSAGARSILLLEDVDAAFVGRSAAGESAARLTFSGLLNAIDGVAAQEGRLLFMTTNHIERLSDALIRPGRVDVRCFLGPATRQQARDLFVSFYTDLPHLLLPPDRQSTAASGHTGLQEVSAAAAVAESGATEITAAAAAAAPPLSGDKQLPGEVQQQQQQQMMQTDRLQFTAAAAAAQKEAAAREAVLQELAEQFAVQLPEEGGVSMARLQGYLMTHRKNPWAAVEDVTNLLQQQQSRSPR